MLHLLTPDALSFTDRYEQNLAALRVLKDLQTTGRAPEETDERVLAHYSAFGQSELLQRLITAAGRGIRVSLTEAEERGLRRASLTAYYTPLDLLLVLWAALESHLSRLPSLRMLEPALGSGMFVATMPIALRRKAQITGVELDLVSSQIASYLHPDVTIQHQGFEEADLPAGSFDLVATNVPFSEIGVFDPRMKEDYLKRTLHDYYLARSVELVRPGGLVVAFTSYGTLDKRDERVRAHLNERARLVTAIRLPQGFARENSGTECGTDLLIFRRLRPGEAPEAHPAWIESRVFPIPVVDNEEGMRFTTASLIGQDTTEAGDETGLRFNGVFADRPGQVLGSIRAVRHNGRLWEAVTLRPGTTIAGELALRLATLPDDLIEPPAPEQPPVAPARAKKALDCSNPRVAGMLAIDAAAKAVLERDAQGLDAAAERATLQQTYRAFVARYGCIHARANQQALKGEPELLFLRALESSPRTDPLMGDMRADEAAIFHQPTVRVARPQAAGTMTPDEALLSCLDEVGQVDIARVATLCGRSIDETIAALAGRIFRVPGTGRIETADEYLSGPVRDKLLVARAHVANGDESIIPNVTALEAVQPEPIPPGKIKARLGATWIPAEDVAEFISSIVPAFRRFPPRGTVTYRPAIQEWVVEDRGGSRHTTDATVTWGTGRVHAIALVEKALAGQMPVVYDTLTDGSRVFNRQETLLAREKLEQIKERFAAWVWEDEARAERLAALYNERFNTRRRRDFNGSHLTLPGINTAILRGGDLAPHQKDAIWMGLQQRAVLLDLCVGAGKTFIGIAWAYELKRLGLANKVLVTAPNHLVEQWAAEANRLYPTMRVLAMSPEDFTRDRRGEFLSRMATEAWDLIVIGHSSFGFLPLGRCEAEFIGLELANLESYLSTLTGKKEKSQADRRASKAIEKKIAALEVRLKENAAMRRDSRRTITWDDLGVDALFVDEAHEFKNLMVPTQMGSIPGVPRGDSKRSFDMRIKTWDLLKRGKRVMFATGTPVLNTIAEVYVWMKYLREDLLEAQGINHFDAWAATFAEVQTVFEMTPDGGGFRMNTRLAKFVNLPELFQLWYQFTFSRDEEQLGLPRPELVTGRPIPVSVPGSPTLKRLVRSFVARVEAIRSNRVDPHEDNILKVMSDGAKAALDVRLVIGGPAEPVNKINVLVEHVARLYEDYADVRGTQLIYCELSTPRPGRRHDTPTAPATAPTTVETA